MSLGDNPQSTTSSPTKLGPKTKVYCEDDYFAEVVSPHFYHLRCDLSPQPSEAPPPLSSFDYGGFEQFLRLKSCAALGRAWREWRELEGNVGLKEFYTDSKLVAELTSIYGDHLDVNHVSFVKIFENYKAQRLEELEAMLEAEKREDFEPEFRDEEALLLEHFSKEELTSFKAVAEPRGAVVPFVLPRKNEDKPKTPSKSGGGNMFSSHVQAILDDHPLGLSKAVLIKKFDERLKQVTTSGGALSRLTSDKIWRELTKDVLFTRDFPREDYLVFPAPLQPVLVKDPMLLLWRVRHRLLILLNLSYGIIEVDKCLEETLRLFRMSHFRPQNWGFRSGLDFVRWAFDQWKDPEVEIVQLALGKGLAKEYVVVMNDERRTMLEEKFGKRTPPTSLPAATPTLQTPWKSNFVVPPQNNEPIPSIPPHCVQIGEKIVQEQASLRPGATFDCVVAFVTSPTNFFVVKKANWRELERLFGVLRNAWNPSESPPHPNHLQRNYLCMCKPPSTSDEEDEVYRVVILGRDSSQKPPHYHVFCIDYGDHLKVPLSHLRFLPRDHLQALEAQSIACCLYNVASPQKEAGTGKDLWSSKVVEFTRHIFNPTDADLPVVRVLFKQRVHGTATWLVKVSRTQTTSTKGSATAKACPDFGEEIMKFCDRKSSK